MSDYKCLNKELVEQVQILKEELGAIRKEHIYLQSKIFEEQQKRIEEKKIYENKFRQLSKNCLLTLKELNISLDIEVSNNNWTNSSREYNSRLSSCTRSSSERFREFQRSTSLRRSSLATVSPTRRSSSSLNKDAEKDQVTVEQEPEQEPEKAEIVKDVIECNKVTEFGLEVFAEGDEECSEVSEESSESISSEIETDSSIVSARQAVTNRRQRMVMVQGRKNSTSSSQLEDSKHISYAEDLTESEISIECPRQAVTIRRPTVAIVQNKISSSSRRLEDNQENSYAEILIESEIDSKDDSQSLKALNNSNEDHDNNNQQCLANQLMHLDLDDVDSIENFSVSEIQTVDSSGQESIHIGVAEAETTSPYPRYTDFRCGDCHTCSTPVGKKRRKPASKENSNNSSSSSCSILRPRRQCAPKNLKEPSLMIKMRNCGISKR